MAALAPSYDTYRDAGHHRQNEPAWTVTVARSLSELMQVTAIRGAAYLGEQSCPYHEEFDGNDFCATHLIGYRDQEPVACLRARFCAEFAKLERLAVRHEFRNSRIAFQIVRAGIELARKKGYRHIYGHAQDRLVPFWWRFGARPMPAKRKLVFSDFSYTEMLLDAVPHPNPITLDSDPYEIVRPEGAWDRLGPLDRSSARPVTSPLGLTKRRGKIEGRNSPPASAPIESSEPSLSASPRATLHIQPGRLAAEVHGLSTRKADLMSERRPGT